mmetsp:Transcript_38378/g.96126  ORF Transcript_38378/g.96126 Transcript_38378/m.96126 type:complete len:292 (-) Transcript_38378:788-1663(-)
MAETNNADAPVTVEATLEDLQADLSHLDDDDWEVTPEQLEQLKAKYGSAEHPLFMPEAPRDLTDYPQLQAIQQLIYENETPESLAVHFKKMGNECHQDGKAHWRDAIAHYTKGIEAGSSDNTVNSQLYSNRAMIRLKLDEHVECVDDARKAIELDPTNVKAYFRAAKASYYLHLFEQAIQFCTQGFNANSSSDPDKTADLAKLRQDIEQKWSALRQKREEERRKEREDAAQREVHSGLVDEAIKARGIRVGPLLYDMAYPAEMKVRLDDEGRLHWPALFLCVRPRTQRERT